MDVTEIKDELKSIEPHLVSIARRCFGNWEEMRDSQEDLYYYTDLNTLLTGILKQKDKISLWASRFSHLNDSEEIKIGLEELRNQKIPNDVVDAFLQMVKLNHSISFSAHHDNLPMWKMYGNGGRGAMLIFDTKELIDQWGGLLQPCIYTHSEQFTTTIEMLFHPESHSEFEQFSVTQKSLVGLHLLPMFISILKNNDYFYEKEIRLVGLGNPFFDKEREQLFRLSNGKIIPYVETFMSKKALKGICLGPLVDSSNKETLEEFLKNKGYDKVVVTQSKIHYR